MTLGRWVQGLGQHGDSVTVVAPSRPDRKEQDSDSFRLFSVPGLPLPRYPELRFGLPVPFRLKRFFAQLKPDLIHIATEGPLGWSALHSARSLKLPLVSSFHTNFHAYGKHYGYGLLRRLVLGWLRYCHNRTQLTFAPSRDVINTLEVDGFRNLRLMDRGVDTALFGPHRRSDVLREQWKVSPQTPVALYVGRLAAEKNIDLSFRAFATMKTHLPDLKMVCVGDGPEKARLQKAYPETIFAGMRTGEDLACHYASADCFLFASITETFGNVVTEAMGSGLPVLAFDYAAPGLLIEHGRSGLLVPFDDSECFIREAGRFAHLQAEWPAMGQAAREAILPRSWEAVVEAYRRDCLSLPQFNQPETA
jgi:glycosyltransferase involved in cell wall biosynthesis